MASTPSRQAAGDATETSGAERPANIPAGASMGTAPRILVFLTAGVLAALASWWAGERYGEWFQIPAELVPLTERQSITLQEQAMLDAAYLDRLYKNTALRLALVGVATAGLLGLAQGLARRSLRMMILGCVVGVLLGGVCGVVGGLADVALGERLARVDIDPAYRTMSIHVAAWLLVSLAVGLTVGLLAGAKSTLGHTLLAALGAGLIAGLLYAPLAAHFFPIQDSDLPVPEGHWNRLLWIGLSVMLVALATARAGRTTAVVEHAS